MDHQKSDIVHCDFSLKPSLKWFHASVGDSDFGFCSEVEKKIMF